MFAIFSFHTGLAEIWSLLRSLNVVTFEGTHYTVIHPLWNTYCIVIAQTLLVPSLFLPQLLALLSTYQQNLYFK